MDEKQHSFSLAQSFLCIFIVSVLYVTTLFPGTYIHRGKSFTRKDQMDITESTKNLPSNFCLGDLKKVDSKIRDKWQKMPLKWVNGTLSVLRAFYDEKNESIHQIRIIAVSSILLADKNSDIPNVTLYCNFFWTTNTSQRVHIHSNLLYGVKHVGFRRPKNHQYVLSCKVQNYSDGVPQYVSIAQSKCQIESQLPVLFPNKTRNGTVGVDTNSLFGNFAADFREATAFIE